MIYHRKIHVLYVITKLELGGAQKVCLSLLKGINKTNNHAMLVSGSEGSLVKEAKKFKNVFFIDNFKREVSLKTLHLEIKSFLKLVEIIKQLKKTYPSLIVHTHSTKAGLIGRWAAFFAKVKNRTHTIHGFGFNDYQSKIKWFVIYFLEYITSFITSHFVCVSKKDRLYGMKLFPLFEKKSSIIRAAVDFEIFFLPAKKYLNRFNDETFIVGTISCLKPQKNVLDLIKAFQHAKQLLPKHKKIKLEIVGDGEEHKKIASWIKKNKLSSSITLHGWQKNTAKFLHSWSIFVLSSLWEGLPCAIIEARLARLPVVAYNVGGIYEIIKNKNNGFLIPPKNWKQLGEAIKLIATDKNVYLKMCDVVDNLEDFKNKIMVQKHISLYRQF
jgi:glycosyltransferase involved in cell wall biosynthesis